MSNYVFEEILDKKRTKELTSDERIKLRLYELHIQEKRTDMAERSKLILFMLDHNLDASLIKYL